jgi:hypothetical protein
MFLAQIGDFMALAFRWIYSRILCRYVQFFVHVFYGKV